MACSGMILIREVADAPVIMGISKPAGLKSPCGEVKIVNPLFVGIDVSSQNNVSCLMDSDGVKYSSFSVQNNLGGAKLLTEKIVSAMETLKLSDVVIGMESTSIYGNCGRTERLAATSERFMCSTQSRSANSRRLIQTCQRMIGWMLL